jgi:hypothetical protein
MAKNKKVDKKSFRDTTKSFLGSIVSGSNPNFITQLHDKLYKKK